MMRKEEGFCIIFLTSDFPREDDLDCKVSAFPTPGRSWIIPNLPMTCEGILGAMPGGLSAPHTWSQDTREPQQYLTAWSSLRIKLGMPRWEHPPSNWGEITSPLLIFRYFFNSYNPRSWQQGKGSRRQQWCSTGSHIYYWEVINDEKKGNAHSSLA